jgi:hypothetical protein
MMPKLVAIGEALVEVMRTGLDQPLDRPAPFVGPPGRQCRVHGDHRQ